MELPINQVLQGDCLEVLKSFPAKSVDLVLTDPPYGIEYEGGFPDSDKFGAITNDKAGDIDFKVLIGELCRVGKRVIIFGANNFYQALPHKGSWICWDKRCNSEADKLFGSKFELAWMDMANDGSGGVKMYRLQHAGAKNADGEGQKRYHPTQKPARLFQQIIKDYGGEIILDPFLGSGTTAIAAKMENRNYIGIEISEKYVAIARERLKSVTTKLF
jgi:DNA modification methylase